MKYLDSPKSLQEYPYPSEKGLVFLQYRSDELIHQNKEALKHLAKMMSITDRIQAVMLQSAMMMNNITIGEAMDSFWKAYGDPYVQGGKLEFRHLMKYITLKRKQDDAIKYYSYFKVLEMVHTGECLMDEFVCLNGKNGNDEVKDRNGKYLWKKLEG